MIHFVPDSASAPVQAPYSEAIARLAGLRQALSLVEDMACMAPSAWPHHDGATATINGEARRDWGSKQGKGGIRRNRKVHMEMINPISVVIRPKEE